MGTIFAIIFVILTVLCMGALFWEIGVQRKDADHQSLFTDAIFLKILFSGAALTLFSGAWGFVENSPIDNLTNFAEAFAVSKGCFAATIAVLTVYGLAYNSKITREIILKDAMQQRRKLISEASTPSQITSIINENLLLNKIYAENGSVRSRDIDLLPLLVKTHKKSLEVEKLLEGRHLYILDNFGQRPIDQPDTDLLRDYLILLAELINLILELIKQVDQIVYQNPLLRTISLTDLCNNLTEFSTTISRLPDLEKYQDTLTKFELHPISTYNQIYKNIIFFFQAIEHAINPQRNHQVKFFLPRMIQSLIVERTLLFNQNHESSEISIPPDLFKELPLKSAL